MSTTLAATDRTKLRRRPHRGHFDLATINRILDAGVIGHVGFAISGKPHVTPTAYWREGDQLYWHGSIGNQMVKADGNEFCVTVSHLDGLIVGRSGFAHSFLYRSVMVFGRPERLEDREDRRRAMHAFIDRLYPGRSPGLRPLHDEELDAIFVMRLPIEEASAKFRSDGVADKPEDLAFDCWAGIIPLHTAIGPLQPAANVSRSPSADLRGFSGNDRLETALARPGSA